MLEAYKFVFSRATQLSGLERGRLEEAEPWVRPMALLGSIVPGSSLCVFPSSPHCELWGLGTDPSLCALGLGDRAARVTWGGGEPPRVQPGRRLKGAR